VLPARARCAAGRLGRDARAGSRCATDRRGMAAGTRGHESRYFIAFLAGGRTCSACSRHCASTSSHWLGRTLSRPAEAVYRRGSHGSRILRDHAYRRVLSRLTADTTPCSPSRAVNLSITCAPHLDRGQPRDARRDETSSSPADRAAHAAPDHPADRLLGRRCGGCRATRRTASRTPAASPTEALNAIQTVKAFTLEDLNSRRFDDAVEDSFRAACAARRCVPR